MMQELLNQHWHHEPADEAVRLLGTHAERGLDTFEVGHRQARLGPNQLTPRAGRSAWVRFLLQFHNPLVYLLLAAGVVKIVLGDVVDAAVILGVVLINAVIGHLQEAKAERAIEALSRSLVTEATVLRAGSTVRIPSTELVPGDVVLLSSGDKVPADLRLVATRDLQIAEAALTGESTAAAKDARAALDVGTPLADRTTMAYASTLVTYGQGRGVVTAIGDATEIGRISEMIAAAPSLETPLTRKVAGFGRQLLVAVLVLAGIVVLAGILRGDPPAAYASSAIALAVGAIPEGIPAALTVTLALGVARMARRRAIIRKLPAVETLGSTSVICSDKTGTLTRNQMTVVRVASGSRVLEVSGDGYAPTGAWSEQGRPIPGSPPPATLECLRAGLLCNDSALVPSDEGDGWKAQGDPTEVALLVAAAKAGLDRASESAAFPRLDAIPFESQHQFMATLHATPGGGPARIYLKGAAEVVIDRCGDALDPEGRTGALDRPAILDQVSRLAADGLRVLAFARVDVPAGTRHIDAGSLPAGFTFLGLQGMIDPPRPEAIEAVEACRRAGIRVKMITGDHAGTAEAIGRQLGLVGADLPAGQKAALTGRDLAALSDAELVDAADRVAVFARVTPEQKLRLVEALQSRRHVVAMTGDGVNDGPALKQADIGIAMGITGTEVAKEASDMVLTDDNFASIRAAVEEGRNVFDNLAKIITWALPANLGQGLVILAAALLGATLPILPLQVLWINMTTGGILGLFLALEPREPDLMHRPPRPADAPLLDRAMLTQVVAVGLLILIAAFGLFQWELRRGASLDAARTVALNTVAVIQALTLVNCRSLRHGLLRIGVFRNAPLWAGIAGVLVLQVALTHIPALQRLFHTASLGADEWLRIAGSGLAALVLIELLKAALRGATPSRTSAR